MRWATNSPLVPALIPRSRYSKISRRPGVHCCSLARLCTKSQGFSLMFPPCTYASAGRNGRSHYSASAGPVIAARRGCRLPIGNAEDFARLWTCPLGSAAPGLGQTLRPANHGDDGLFALKQALGDAPHLLHRDRLDLGIAGIHIVASEILLPEPQQLIGDFGIAVEA